MSFTIIKLWIIIKLNESRNKADMIWISYEIYDGLRDNKLYYTIILHYSILSYNMIDTIYQYKSLYYASPIQRSWNTSV